jgi:hypothetical protein
MGDSILMSPSNKLWERKRRHLSIALYKDNLASMMRTVVVTVVNYISKWEDGKKVNICEETS